jgi:hypothetical protein
MADQAVYHSAKLEPSGLGPMSSLQRLRIACCSCQGVQDCYFGMPGRVWQTGSVQVVQNIGIIPPSIHPRCALQEAQLEAAAEVCYIPVYDICRPNDGPAAVFECILSSTAADTMLVATLISYIGTVLCTQKVGSRKNRPCRLPLPCCMFPTAMKAIPRCHEHVQQAHVVSAHPRRALTPSPPHPLTPCRSSPCPTPSRSPSHALPSPASGPAMSPQATTCSPQR